MDCVLSLLIIFAIIAFVVEIAVLCFKSNARNFPTNYILLGTFTFCEAYLISFICG